MSTRQPRVAAALALAVAVWLRPPQQGAHPGDEQRVPYVATYRRTAEPIERLVEPDRADGILDQLALLTSLDTGPSSTPRRAQGSRQP